MDPSERRLVCLKTLINGFIPTRLMLCLVKNYAGIEDLQCLTILLEQANCV